MFQDSEKKKCPSVSQVECHYVIGSEQLVHRLNCSFNRLVLAKVKKKPPKGKD